MQVFGPLGGGSGECYSSIQTLAYKFVMLLGNFSKAGYGHQVVRGLPTVFIILRTLTVTPAEQSTRTPL